MQPEREIAGGFGDPLLLVLVDDVIAARRAFAARLAEHDLRAGDLLQLDGDVLEHVAEPRPAVLVQTPHEAAFGAEGAGVAVQARNRREEPCVEAVDPGARPLLELAEIDGQADDREASIQTGPTIDAAFEEFHRLTHSPGAARRVSRSKVPPSINTCSRTFVILTGLPSFASAMDEWESSEASMMVKAPAPTTVELALFVDERGRVLVQADAHGEGVVGQRGQEPAEAIALAEVLVDHDAVGQTEARDQRDGAGVGRVTLGAVGDHVLAEDGGAGAGAAHRDAAGVRTADGLGDRCPAQDRRETELVSARHEDAVRRLDVVEPLLASRRLRGTPSGSALASSAPSFLNSFS